MPLSIIALSTEPICLKFYPFWLFHFNLFKIAIFLLHITSILIFSFCERLESKIVRIVIFYLIRQTYRSFLFLECSSVGRNAKIYTFRDQIFENFSLNLLEIIQIYFLIHLKFAIRVETNRIRYYLSSTIFAHFCIFKHLKLSLELYLSVRDCLHDKFLQLGSRFSLQRNQFILFGHIFLFLRQNSALFDPLKLFFKTVLILIIRSYLISTFRMINL